MIRIALTACLLASAVSFAEPAPDIITLEEAINTALLGNRDLAALELELNGRALSAESARYRFAYNLYPVADATARSTSDTLRYGLRGTREFVTGTEIEAGVRAQDIDFDAGSRTRSGIVHVQIAQPLFRDFGTLVNREGIVRADSRLTAARRSLELRKNDLLVSVVETCQGLLRLQRQIADETDAIERYDRLYRLTRAREKQGRATRVERLRVELLKGQAEARKAAAEEQLRSLQAEFADLLGAAPDRRMLPVDDDDLRLSLPDRDTALQTALSNRLDLAQALHDRTDAQRGTRIARKQLQPDLAIVGRYEWFGEGETWDDAWALDQDTWAVGLLSDADLLLRDERIGVRQAALDESSADLRVQDVTARVIRQVDQALSACRRAETEQDIAEQNLELARQRAELARRLFEKGRIDHTSATDAEVELQQARTQLLNARAETVIAGYRLLRIMGVLIASPDELKPAASTT